MVSVDPQQLIQSWIAEYGREDVNAGWFLVGRHALTKPEHGAFHLVTASGEDTTYTFAMLDEMTARIAGGLRDLGVEAGDRVAALLPKGLPLALTALAAWRLGAIYVPLFTAFGSEAVSYRLTDSQARVVVTDQANRHKVPEGNRAVVVVEPSPQQSQDQSFEALLRASSFRTWTARKGSDAMILLYTSGTTGQPKGVVVPIWALAAFEAYMRFGLDLQEGDRFWNMADPGWAYGLYFGLVGPLLLGQETLAYQGPFDPEQTMQLLKQHRITNFAAAPTAFRAMRASDLGPQDTVLRVLSSAGEPLNPEVSTWAEEVFGIPIFDHYGQTELGMVINNHHMSALRQEVLPGSMGVAMPGIKAAVVDDDGQEVPRGCVGHLAIDVKASPLFWFSGYYRAPERTQERFTADGHYYLTGDDANQDIKGNFFFSGRSDDIILSAGYRIGPFEVENMLMTHKAVAECAVIGVPDALRGESVKAFVVLRDSYQPSSELEKELKEWVRQRLAKTAYPREIDFVAVLPKTPSGKVQRFRLRSR
ncbi:MAG: AMP-binding protein [Sulfobacillus thermotolerans]|nr:AMP-binding protein [Sulfobacillus thermotolerans]